MTEPTGKHHSPTDLQLVLLAVVLPVLTALSLITMILETEVYPTLAMPGFAVTGSEAKRYEFSVYQFTVRFPDAPPQILHISDILDDSFTGSFAAPIASVIKRNHDRPEVREWLWSQASMRRDYPCGFEIILEEVFFDGRALGGEAQQVDVERYSLGVSRC